MAACPVGALTVEKREANEPDEPDEPDEPNEKAARESGKGIHVSIYAVGTRVEARKK
jgi:hypothetical protein